MAFFVDIVKLVTTALTGSNANKSTYVDNPTNGTTTGGNNTSNPSGLYTVLDETNKPIGQNAGWGWSVLRIKQSQNLAGKWLSEIWAHWESNALFERSYNDQSGTFQSFKRILTTRWFPVKEGQTYSKGQQLMFINGEFQIVPRTYNFVDYSAISTYTVNVDNSDVVGFYSTAIKTVTLIVDHAKIWNDCEIVFKFYPGSALLTVNISSTGASSQFEQDNGTFGATYQMISTNVLKRVKFRFFAGNWERVE
jgi:hypothetical protein